MCNCQRARLRSRWAGGTLRGWGRCGAYYGPPRLSARPVYQGCPPCWAARGTPYTLAPPLRDVPWQRRSLDSYLLLLCEDGSHGLDLSFCTHIFIIHRILDPSLRQQVIARAHRMGASLDKGVVVQTLHLFDQHQL